MDGLSPMAASGNTATVEVAVRSHRCVGYLSRAKWLASIEICASIINAYCSLRIGIIRFVCSH
jgi:hypothetical protein